MVKRALSVGATVTLLASVAFWLGGATLPESYPLSEAGDAEANPVDANLTAWLAQHVERPSPFDLDSGAFKEFVDKQDPLTASYLKVARVNRESPATSRAEVEAALKQLGSPGAARSPAGSPLVAPLIGELLRSGTLTPEETAGVMTTFAETGVGTCAAKEMVLDEIASDRLQKLSDEGLRDLLARINSYRSNNFKRSALRRFVANLPEERQAAVTDSLLGVAQPYPPVIRSSPWLRNAAEKAGKLAAAGAGAQFEEARQQASKRLCSKAKDVLLAGIATVKNGKASEVERTLEDAVSTAKAIDGCYRARSPQLRTEFWKNITQVMQDTYGLPGWFEAKLRLGYIHWSADEFEAAKPLFTEVVTKAQTQATWRRFEARAVYAMARIAENESDLPRAAVSYRDYVSRFSDQENFEEALMALVLIHVGQKEWTEAMGPLEAMIAQQGVLPLDDRSTGALSFALFWAGRIHLERGQRRAAAEMWRRVASEYYSTYYGAMGHYMLEQLAGRRLMLQPARTPTFRMHALRDAFAPSGRERVRRVETLMRLGLRDHAICELEELDTDGGMPEKLLVRAMMLHASGEWLDAIKAYDALPRSFRNTLPSGFERILFPKRYDADVRALAAKAEVDPDLVLAIIRQESVFNPLARSAVGAMGLMQLMPATARVESKRLASTYVNTEEKRMMRQRVDNPMNLLVAETNLTLGIHHVRTLLDLYQSPVYLLSAYNASPSAAKRWMNSIPTGDVLSFIERIPYKETRAYVKLVLRNYFYYKRWYGDPKDSLTHLAAVTSPLVAMTKEAKPEPAAATMETPAAEH